MADRDLYKLGEVEKTGLQVEALECPICYHICVHPTRLPCGHVFCFLCAKGVVTRTRKCAMCRQPVSLTYLESPDLLDQTHLEVDEEAQDKILWFYQARSRGWWLYEKRIANELEEKYQKDNEAAFDLQIAGFIYTIDFKSMQQYRKEDRAISRAIKRDLIKHVELKGNAGIRLDSRGIDQTDHAIDHSLGILTSTAEGSQAVEFTSSLPQLLSDLTINNDSPGNRSNEPESLV